MITSYKLNKSPVGQSLTSCKKSRSKVRFPSYFIFEGKPFGDVAPRDVFDALVCVERRHVRHRPRSSALRARVLRHITRAVGASAGGKWAKMKVRWWRWRRCDDEDDAIMKKMRWWREWKSKKENWHMYKLKKMNIVGEEQQLWTRGNKLNKRSNFEEEEASWIKKSKVKRCIVEEQVAKIKQKQ
jgi:hypothetical protein